MSQKHDSYIELSRQAYVTDFDLFILTRERAVSEGISSPSDLARTHEINDIPHAERVAWSFVRREVNAEHNHMSTAKSHEHHDTSHTKTLMCTHRLRSTREGSY